MKLIFSILVFILFANVTSAQKDTLRHRNDTVPLRTYLIQNVERNGVTMPEVEIKEVTVIGRPRTAKRNEYKKYERLILNVKRVYPYALMVRRRLNQVNEEMKTLKDEKARKAYMKEVEKDVFAEYEDDMRHMTMTQGRLLIKLIDRETHISRSAATGTPASRPPPRSPVSPCHSSSCSARASCAWGRACSGAGRRSSS